MNHDKQFQLYADAVKNELQMAYQQGRADAIDEMVDFFDNKSICVNNKCIHMNDEYSCVRCITEQLKEQKNDI